MGQHLDIHGGQSVRAATRSRRGRSTSRQLGVPSGSARKFATQGSRRRSVAILDSDSGFLLVLGKRLEHAGWERLLLTGRLSVKRAASLEVDALVVDASLLGAGRLKWLNALCEQRPDLSVIVCTASSTVLERVTALRAGVDDWLGKPCHPEELVARVESATLHRWRSAIHDAEPIRIGEVEIRPDQFQAFVGGSSLRLTRREYQLLELLCDAGGEVLPRERIYECLWGYEMARNDRSVDVFVHKLRRKIECHSPDFAYIHTHFGIGYRLDPAPAEEQDAVAA